jgi:ABC-type glycerol-3-phosphate transport system substrate-binding protein
VKRLAVTFGFLAVLLAACGGNGAPGAAKAAYIAQGDVICRNTITAVSSIGAGTDTATLEKARDAWNQANDKFTALAVPQEDQDKALVFTAGIHNVTLTAEDAVQGSIVGDEQRVQKSLQTEATSKKQAGEAAKTYGFKVCSQL